MQVCDDLVTAVFVDLLRFDDLVQTVCCDDYGYAYDDEPWPW